MASTKSLCFSISILALVVNSIPLAAQSYGNQLTGLDFIGGGASSPYNYVHGMTANGSVVVGESQNDSGQTEAFRWTAELGTQGLGFIGGGGTSPHSNAQSISADGRVIVGYGHNASNQTEAFRWTSGTGMEGLGFVDGGGIQPFSNALGVSADGSVIVGASSNADGNAEAFRWTAETGIQGIGFIPGGSISFAHSVNAGGTVIVGMSVNANGKLEAFRWTSGTGMQGLSFINGGGNRPASDAHGVSADGAVVVGASTNAANQSEAFRWTSEVGMQGLGFIDGGGSQPFSDAYGVSADGATIVGESQNANNQTEAFIWTSGKGMQSVAGLLTANGVSLGTWELSSADAVSADGTIIIGNGKNPDGYDQAWIVRVVDGSPSEPISPTPLPPSPSRVGFITPQEMQATIRDTASIVLQSGSSVNSALDDMRFVAQEQCQPGETEASRFCVFATGSAGFWTNNGEISDGRNLSGSAGSAIRLAPGVQAGLAFSTGKARYDLRLGGKHNVTAYGVSGFLSYAQNGYEGLQLLAAGTVMQADLEIRRSYMNGASAVSQSEGDTTGYGAGILGRLGWGMRVLDKTWLTPFVELNWSRMRHNGYSETGGVFPIRYDRQRYYQSVLRTGVEARHQINADLSLFGSVAWAHNLLGEGSSLNGVMVDVFQLSSGNISLKKNWAELTTGASWAIMKNTRLSGSVSTALGNDEKPAASLRIGISADF